MRCILASCLVLVVATPAWAQNTAPVQEPFYQPPSVSTAAPNIHAPGATAVTTPSTVMQQGTVTSPVATTPTTTGSSVATQPGATTVAPAGNVTYYYYPAGNSRRMFRVMAPATVYSTNPTPVYTTPTQYYYTTVRRGPFGLFRRRMAQPVYTTAGYTTTPTYYTSPGYYYTPTTYILPTTTSPAGAVTNGAVAPNTTTGTTSPVYTPTTYTAPNEAPPASTVNPSGSTTAPSSTLPPGTTLPTRSIPTPPPVNPR